MTLSENQLVYRSSQEEERLSADRALRDILAPSSAVTTWATFRAPLEDINSALDLSVAGINNSSARDTSFLPYQAIFDHLSSSY